MMDFEDSGIDSDPKIDSLDFHSPAKAAPIISFSPDRSRFSTSTSSSGVTDTILSLTEQPSGITKPKCSDQNESTTSELSSSSDGITSPRNNGFKCATSPTTTTTTTTSSTSSSTATDLQKRLERRIARANSSSGGSQQWTVGIIDKSDSSAKRRTSCDDNQVPPVQSSNVNGKSGGTGGPSSVVGSSGGGGSSQTTVVGTGASGFDTRKVPTLLPPQRLAIPQKSANSSFPSNNSNEEGSSSENKPLVQWDSADESEEELSFFPPPKSRGILNDNLSIDNMSMSGEEDDLHLSPPRPLAQRCPCDPRHLFDSTPAAGSSSSSSSNTKNCSIV